MKYPLSGLLTLAPTAAFGQGALLNLTPGGPTAGAGDARTTEVSAFSAVQNPATMHRVGHLEVGASVLRFSGRTAPVLSVVVPLGARLHLGAYGGLLVEPDALEAVFPGETAPSRFGSGYAGLALSAGRQSLSGGLGAKVYTEDFGRERVTWLAFDAGAHAALAGGDVQLGVAARNFGQRLDGSACAPQDLDCMDEGELASSLHAGAAWQAFSVREAETGTVIARVRLRAEGVSNAFDASTLNVGLEVEGFDVVALRVGHVDPLGADNLTGRWTFGAGVRFDRLLADVALLPDFGFGTDTGLSFGVRLIR